jgi:hypothetical protein
MEQHSLQNISFEVLGGSTEKVHRYIEIIEFCLIGLLIIDVYDQV